MKQKRLNILGLIHLGAALISLIICIWDVIALGLFAPAVDITGGIGVALVCALGELLLCAVMFLVGMNMRKKYTAKTFKYGLLMVALSLLSLIFCLIGAYVVLPSIFGILLFGATLMILR